jgi:hypothetical protein
MDALAIALERSPEWFPHSLDLRTDSVVFVRLMEADYARASFLDARILGPLAATQVHPWPDVEMSTAATSLREGCDFIFHIGHVGSTLLSRLLGRSRTILALREPLILRTFTQIAFDRQSRQGAWPAEEWERRASVFLKLWSRSFREEQRACIKASSFVSEIAAQLMARPGRQKALLMTVHPESYLAAILGGPNSRQEIRVLAPSRFARLQRRAGADQWRLESLSEGEVIAMSWACEMAGLCAAARAAPEHALWIDFDRFLADPAAALSRAMLHLRGNADPHDIRAMLSAQDLRRYSKAPEHAYDTRLRQAVLEQARHEHGEEIRRGLVWLDRAALQSPLISEALGSSAQTT